MSTSKNKSKVPAPLPKWVAKCIWANTAVNLIVDGKSETDAWDRAWRKVARTEGGDSCLQVKILRRI